MNDTAQLPFVLDTESLKADATASGFPERYTVKETGGERILTCLEAPNLQVMIKSGFTVSASAAKKYPPGTIFLDGAAQAEPFLDHERKVYNLDHHEGCVRTFTFATCEQALIMCLKGLNLRDQEWKIFANEPDLDTVLAIWILLNHQRVNNREAINRNFLITLVRLEGVIDALGLEMREMCGFSPDLMEKLMGVIDALRAEELELKKSNLWAETDFADYTLRILRKLDQFLINIEHLNDFKGIEELARVDLINNRIAIVVASELGIYEIEPYLTKVYGNRVGWVALRRGNNDYTLRQMDLFMPVTLEDVYQRLNYIDPAVKGRMGTNRWGGSGDIGGSPRGFGTRLTPAEIASACRDVIEKRSDIRQVKRFLLSAGVLLLILLAAFGITSGWKGFQDLLPAPLRLPLYNQALIFYGALLVITLIGLSILAFRRPWQFGIMFPVGKTWWCLLPVAILCGLTGKIIVPGNTIITDNIYVFWTTTLVLIPFSLELLFLGLVHGMMAQLASIQDANSRWFFSGPTIGTAILYAVTVGAQILLLSSRPLATLTSLTFIQYVVVALAFAIGAGMIRERSHSILPAWLFHALAVLTAVLVYG
ncbi:hypothetical protein LJC71_00775 [Desulfosarcina sp. OttesenSCG-928-A07]|nr:hypothetical protein [Desulfosarcina sp. OttesenSCG-928-G17]MDL2328274.1 hypothetical protein [Desulfosarcina sp. OttesenSCG-928-A07]